MYSTDNVYNEQLQTALLRVLENSKKFKSLNLTALPESLRISDSICEIMDAFLRSESVQTIEHVPCIPLSLFEDDRVNQKLVEFFSSCRSIKHFDVRDSGVRMFSEAMLKMLTALHDSNTAVNLHTLHLGDSGYYQCSFGRDAECNKSMWALLQNAHNLTHL